MRAKIAINYSEMVKQRLNGIFYNVYSFECLHYSKKFLS